jgi:hypothetical protein
MAIDSVPQLTVAGMVSQHALPNDWATCIRIPPDDQVVLDITALLAAILTELQTIRAQQELLTRVAGLSASDVTAIQTIRTLQGG